MIEIIIADDHGLIRKGINLLLESATDIKIVGEAQNGLEALKLVKELQPQVVVTDISMPEMNGIELTKNITQNFKNTHVLILSNYVDDEHILECFEAGALGYLPKNADEKVLSEAIYKIAQGDIFYTKTVLDILSKNILTKNKPRKSIKASLTSREKEILSALINGASNKQIADKLSISNRTVDAHRRNIMKKLNVSNSAQLVKYTIEHNLL